MPERANHAHDKTRALQRKLYLAAKRSRPWRFHAFYDRIHRRDVMERAWEPCGTPPCMPRPHGSRGST